MRWFLRRRWSRRGRRLICVEAGWIVTEVGRQPWVVYEILRTEDAVTDVGAGGRLDLASRSSWCSTPALAVGAVLVIRG